MRENLRAKLRFSVISVCFLLSLAQACRGTPGVQRAVCGRCEGPERFVRLQTYQDVGSAEDRRPFDHPLHLSEETWKRILSTIRTQTIRHPLLFSRVKEAPEDVFGAEDIDFLSGPLARAFAAAGPEEWVVFGVSRAGPPGVTELTTGGWFVSESTLHLQLANHRVATTLPNVRELLWSDPLRPNGEPDFEFVASENQTVENPGILASWSLTGSVPDMRINYRAFLPEAERGLSGTREQAAPAPPSVQREGVAPAGSLEERLEELKRLKDKGLITEEDYRMKKKDLLESL